MELTLLVDFLYINGGRVPNKLAAVTRWKCALARSPWLPQPPTICYHGKLSVRAVPPLYHSAVKTPLYCKMLKNHHLSLQPSLFLSTRCYFFWKNYFLNGKSVGCRRKIICALVTGLLDETGEGLGWQGLIVATDTAWLTAWRNEDKTPIMPEVCEWHAQKQKGGGCHGEVSVHYPRTVCSFTCTHMCTRTHAHTLDKWVKLQQVSFRLVFDAVHRQNSTEIFFSSQVK